jgi:hypothetical protein
MLRPERGRLVRWAAGGLARVAKQNAECRMLNAGATERGRLVRWAAGGLARVLARAFPDVRGGR